MFGQSYAGWKDPGIGAGATGVRQMGMFTHKATTFTDDNGNLRTRFDPAYTNRGSEIHRIKAYRGKQELERLKKIFANLNVVNPYQNMEKTLGSQNLQVDKKAAEYEKDQFTQTQSNLLQNLRAAGGGSWAVNAIARQGQMAAKAVSAKIGKQESRNKMLAAKQSDRIQELQRKGRSIPTQFHAKKLAMLMGMTQKEYNMHQNLELGYFGIRKGVETAAAQAKQAWIGQTMSFLMKGVGGGVGKKPPVIGASTGG